MRLTICSIRLLPPVDPGLFTSVARLVAMVVATDASPVSMVAMEDDDTILVDSSVSMGSISRG